MDRDYVRRVLVVDDDPIQREILRAVCSKLGTVAVTEAENGFEARRALEAARVPFDLMTIDLSMPENDGFELMDYLRHTNCQIPVIVASAMPSHIVEMSKALSEINHLKVIGHFQKPLDLDTIGTVINSTILSYTSEPEVA